MVKWLRWTETAIECYERGCVCQGCSVSELITSQKCRMKQSVLELVRQIGAPQKEDNSLFPDFHDLSLKILEALYNGCETLEELNLQIGSSIAGIKKVFYNNIIPCYIEKGFCKPTKNTIPAFIDFFRNYYNEFKEKEFVLMYDEDLKLKYADFLVPLVKAIKSGYETNNDLITHSGMTSHQISCYWTHILTPLIKTGLIIKNPDKTQKQEVIDFIRNRLIDVQNGTAEEPKEPEQIKKEKAPKKKTSAENQQVKKKKEEKTENNINQEVLTTTKECKSQTQTIETIDKIELLRARYLTQIEKLKEQIILTKAKLEALQELEDFKNEQN